MTIFERFRKFFSNLFTKKEKAPLYANCYRCGERVYLPFLCNYCHNYYCGEHRLLFNHDCKNIDDWKKQGSSSGTAIEYRAGRGGSRK
jgi:predicted nucleic acid binding AN1-type Zn finger protein